MRTEHIALTITHDDPSPVSNWGWESLLNEGQSAPCVVVVHGSPVEHLTEAFRHLERARADVEREGGWSTDADSAIECIALHLDDVSHFLQETFTALGLPQPELLNDARTT